MNLLFHNRFLFDSDPDATLAATPDIHAANPYAGNEAAISTEWSATNPDPAAEAPPDAEDGLASLESLTKTEPAPEPVTPDPEPVKKGYSRRELQGQLDETSAKLKELEENGQQVSQKYQDAEKSIADLRKELEARDQAYVAQAVPDYDPNQDEELQTIGKSIGSKLQSTVPFLNSDHARSTVKTQLPRMLEGFGHHLALGAIAPFKELLEQRLFTKEQLEESPEECARDLTEVIKLCRELYPDHVKYQETLTRNQETWDQKRETGYAEKRKGAEAVFGNIGTWTADQIKENPTHPQAILSGLMQANPKVAEEIKTLAKAHVEFAAGSRPLPRNANPQQIAQHREFQRRALQINANAVENAFYMQIIPNLVAHLYESNQKLTKRLAGSSAANRPDAATENGKAKTLATIPDLKPGQDISTVKNPYV